MTDYTFPQVTERPTAAPQTAYLIASGDLRESANAAGWPTQLAARGRCHRRPRRASAGRVVRAHDVDPRDRARLHLQPAHGHGGLQEHPRRRPARRGRGRSGSTPTTCWPACARTAGPILTVANFAGDWPGLVGLLGLNAGLTKMGQEYSTLWSVDFTDDWFRAGLKEWVDTGRITHDASHVRALPTLPDEPGGRARPGSRRRAAGREGHHRRLRRGLHGHVQRHLRRRAAQPDRHLQGAAHRSRRCTPRCSRSPMPRPTPPTTWLTERGMTFTFGRTPRPSSPESRCSGS